MSYSDSRFSKRTASYKGRIYHKGLMLHFSGEGWVKDEAYSWFGTRDQAKEIIARLDLPGTWEWDDRLMRDYRSSPTSK